MTSFGVNEVDDVVDECERRSLRRQSFLLAVSHQVAVSETGSFSSLRSQDPSLALGSNEQQCQTQTAVFEGIL